MVCMLVFIILPLIATAQARISCGVKDIKRVQEMFKNCTKTYKAEYNRDVMHNKDSVLSITCKLVDKLVNVCGDEWLECHGEEEVRRMKELQVESFLNKNRDALPVDIEKCDTVQQFRSEQLLFEDPPSCTDNQTVKSQELFQNCTHSITTSVNDKIQSLTSAKSISSIICQALNSISSDCIKHLEKCLDEEDVIILTETHIEQLKTFFINLAGKKVEEDIRVDQCQDTFDKSKTSEKEIRNAKEDSHSESGHISEKLTKTNKVPELMENIEDTTKEKRKVDSEEKDNTKNHNVTPNKKNVETRPTATGFILSIPLIVISFL